MTIGTLSPTEKDLYKIVALVRQLAERNNRGVATADLNDDAVTNAKLANMAQATVKGRAAGAGAGDPSDLGVAQLIALLGIPANIRVFTIQRHLSDRHQRRREGDGATRRVAAEAGADQTPAWPSGGGGGEGAESWKLLSASTLSGQTVTVAAGGAATPANTNSAETGGTSSIGTVITAPGGFGGLAGPIGGAGGAVVQAAPKIGGCPGLPANSVTTVSPPYLSLRLVEVRVEVHRLPPVSPIQAAVADVAVLRRASGAGGSGIVVCMEFGVI